MAVVDLAPKRLTRLERTQRETEKALKEINQRLERLEGTVGQAVAVLETHSRHFQRMEETMIGIAERIDLLTAAIARGRAKDLVRVNDQELRLRRLESRTRSRPRSK